MSDGGFGPGGTDLSVMIPTYNCAGYLGAALASLEDQGISGAQVVVVDDCSTADDPEAVVAESRLPGITFVRQPRNLGLVGNFNSCIERAERRWVHVLHGDDHILPGGYAALASVIEAHPDVEAVFGRCVMIDELGVWDGITKPVGPEAQGPLAYDPRDWRLNRLQFAGIVFRADAAARVGGFSPEYAHCADWHLWWRLAKQVPSGYTNTCVGAYRRFAGSHTASLVKTGGNLREGLALVEEVAAAEPQVGPELFRPLFGLVLEQGSTCAGDDKAVLAHAKLLLDFPAALPRRKAVARLALRHAKARAAGRIGYAAP